MPWNLALAIVALLCLLAWVFTHPPKDPPPAQLCFDFDYEHLPRLSYNDRLGWWWRRA